MDSQDEHFLSLAIKVAQKGMDNNEGGPFGAIVVKDGEVIGQGNNKVTSLNDPTAHAEVVAIRNACAKLQTFQLSGCTIYCSCEPCPMCLGAIYWSRPDRIVYACSKEDAAEIGFDDQFIYKEIDKPAEKRSIPAVQLLRAKGKEIFRNWQQKPDKIDY